MEKVFIRAPAIGTLLLPSLISTKCTKPGRWLGQTCESLCSPGLTTCYHADWQHDHIGVCTGCASPWPYLHTRKGLDLIMLHIPVMTNVNCSWWRKDILINALLALWIKANKLKPYQDHNSATILRDFSTSLKLFGKLCLLSRWKCYVATIIEKFQVLKGAETIKINDKDWKDKEPFQQLAHGFYLIIHHC